MDVRKSLVAILLLSIPSFARNVTLSWVDILNLGVTYNVYRAKGPCASPGTFTEIASGISSLTYTDTTATRGTWCYQITAENTSLTESDPSNIGTGTIEGTTTMLEIGL